MAGLETVTYTPLAEQHLAACAAIAATAPDPWSETSFVAELQANRPAWVALAGSEVVAFACFAPEGETAVLSLVAVHPAHRGQHMANSLLRHCFLQLKQQEFSRCVLEVRCSNNAALALYNHLGFEQLAHRRGLYKNPAEDGLTLGKKL